MLIKSLADLIAAAALRRAKKGVVASGDGEQRRDVASRTAVPRGAGRSVPTRRESESRRRIVLAALLLCSILLFVAAGRALAPLHGASRSRIAELPHGRDEARGFAHAHADAP